MYGSLSALTGTLMPLPLLNNVKHLAVNVTHSPSSLSNNWDTAALKFIENSVSSSLNTVCSGAQSVTSPWEQKQRRQPGTHDGLKTVQFQFTGNFSHRRKAS